MKVNVLFKAISIALLSMSSQVMAANYYYDCDSAENGSGTESSPYNNIYSVRNLNLQPGDNVLIKSGSTCTVSAPVYINDKDGTVESPISISKYGQGALPKIIFDNKAGGAVIRVDNSDYIKLSDLDLSHAQEGVGERRGVWILANGGQNVEGLLIENLLIHDIVGLDHKFGNGSAGILLYNKDEEGSFFKNHVIQYNILTNVHRSGIEYASAIQSDINSTNPPFTFDPKMKSTGILVKGNYLEDIGGDGLVFGGIDKSSIEHNEIHRAANRSSQHNVGIWSRNSQRITFQYNAVYNTRQHTGTSDGQSYDLDWYGYHNVFQYNYSENNQGGFMLLCADGKFRIPASEHSNIKSPRGIIRYNLSVNDGYSAYPFKNYRNRKSLFSICFTQPEDIEINNNVFYSDNGQLNNLVTTYGNNLSDTSFQNNVFLNDTSANIFNANSTSSNFNSVVFTDNSFSGSVTNIPAQTGNNQDEAQFLGPLFSSARTLEEGFKLNPSSAMIDSGTSTGLRWPLEYDYYGNVIQAGEAISRGIYNAVSTQSIYAYVPQQELSIAGVNSEEVEKANKSASLAIDGVPATNWHSKWSDRLDEYSIDLDLGEQRKVNFVEYVPRQDGGVNGIATRYEIYVTDDLNNWGLRVAEGTLAGDSVSKKIRVREKSGRYVRLVILDNEAIEKYASASEIKVIYRKQ